MTDRQFERLVEEFYKGALYLIDHIKRDGWHWSSNFLRELVRVRSGLKFTNSLSPRLLREVIRRHPELGGWIDIKPLKGD